MSKFVHTNAERVNPGHESHEGYEYYKRNLLPGEGRGCKVSQYDIPPGKSVYPYHFHARTEETFYILSGRGLLRTPDGEREVAAGDLLYFPSCPDGAHKLTNVSDDEMLIYLDFDVIHDFDVMVYPDSNKLGIFGHGLWMRCRDRKSVV